MAKKLSGDAERRERVQQMRQTQARKELRTRILIIGSTALALVVIAGGVTWTVMAEQRAAQIDNVASFDDLPRDHVPEPVAATELPPAGGKHSQILQNCGVYNSPIKNENALHSMEHGAVWITYQPSLAPADIQTLDEYAHGQTHILVSPYPDQPVPVVATAWGKQIQLADVSDPQLGKFVKQYQNGPQTPEPGAPCSGGIGDPIHVHPADEMPS